MGDRCYMTIHLHGSIETVETLNAVVAAIEAEYMWPNDFTGNGPDNIRAHLLDCAKRGEAPAFYASEVNYANIDELEDALQEAGLPYHVQHDAGGSYPGGCWSWMPQAGKIDAVYAQDSGPVVTVEELRKALKSDDPLQAISDMVSDADAADGSNLPPFTLAADLLA